MKSFLHDSSAFDDEKVYELYLNYDFKALGIFYVILEKLAKQEKPIKEDILKRQLHLTKRDDVIIDFMVELDLIQRENGEISNQNLMNYIETYVDGRKKSAERMKKNRDNQRVSENVTPNNQRSYTSNTNTNTKTKSNTKDKLYRFEEFWDSYGKKIGKPKTIEYWKKLSDKDVESIFKVLPSYLKEREPRFRKDPERFLKHRVWEDQVVLDDIKQDTPRKIERKEIVIPENF